MSDDRRHRNENRQKRIGLLKVSPKIRVITNHPRPFESESLSLIYQLHHGYVSLLSKS